ncbi:nucleotidyltransferase domain-containing protein [Chungangia koreensis]|uniref:Nucleotidyltransferase domain-containing protein n=1 Tax=Chungangia koreensis TaxID=752657 RepID=A0ABV8X4L3_9LACT
MFEPCKKIKELMSGFDRPWAIAGGWAVDLHVNRLTREHSDIEIAVFRHDQFKLKQYLNSFAFRKVVNGQLIEWSGEELILPVHELHASNGEQDIEILLNESKDGNWLFRREPQIYYDAGRVIENSTDSFPYLIPVIVLLYKAKHLREMDHADFLVLRDVLNDKDRIWLLKSLEIHQPGHPWIRLLGGIRT